MSTVHPIGARGILLKLCWLHMYAYAEIFDAMVVCLCVLPVLVTNPTGALKMFYPPLFKLLWSDPWMCFLLFLLLLSMHVWGMFWYLMPWFHIVWRNYSKVLLSSMCFLIILLLWFTWRISLLYALHILHDVLFFVGSTRMRFPSVLHSIMMYLFP